MVAKSNAVHARVGKMFSFIRANLSRNQAVASDEKWVKIGVLNHKYRLAHDSPTIFVDSSIFCCRSFLPVYEKELMNSCNPICRRIACAMMGLALFLVAGGHWAMLQGIAWTSMVRDFSKSGSLTEAVSKTFDGKHPCPLCKKIAKAKSSESPEEKAPATVKAEKKAEVFVSASNSALPTPVVRPFVYGPAPFVSMPERSFAPPVPVPISALV